MSRREDFEEIHSLSRVLRQSLVGSLGAVALTAACDCFLHVLLEQACKKPDPSAYITRMFCELETFAHHLLEELLKPRDLN